MSRFEFTLAGPPDDAALRRRMAEDRMDGHVSVSFRREPSYFAGCQLQGEAAQVIKCTDRVTGTLVGLGSRLTLQAFVNGVPARIGYLSDLRAAPAYRGGTLLARGYRFLRQLHEQDPTPLYYSIILEGNQAALRNLTGARAGLPHYRDLGRILSPAIHLDMARHTVRETGLRFVRGRPGQLTEIMAFLRREYARKQLAPVYQASDFATPRLRDLQPEDITLALRGERIVGTLAAWDQHRFRQTHIERYSAPLALMRPGYNLLARVTPLKPLPATGDRIPYFYLALAATEGNDPAIFRALLAQVYETRRRGPWNYCIAGLHESDPLAEVLTEYRRIESAGRLFVIHYPEDEPAFRALDSRPPYVEIGTA